MSRRIMLGNSSRRNGFHNRSSRCTESMEHFPGDNEPVRRPHRREYHLQTRVQKLTLEEMYNGTYKKLCWLKKDDCGRCKGQGSRSAAGARNGVCELCVEPVACSEVCELCEGTGMALIPEDRCDLCHGKKKVTTDEIYFDVAVMPGVPDGHSMVVESNDRFGVPCKLKVIIAPIRHRTFKRDDKDLHATIQLDYVEALAGFQKRLMTLDKRCLEIRRKTGDIVQDNDIQIFKYEGMPSFDYLGERGNLIVKFQVDLPKLIREAMIRRLEGEPDAKTDNCQRYINAEGVFDRLTGRRFVEKPPPPNQKEPTVEPNKVEEDDHFSPSSSGDQYDNEIQYEEYEVDSNSDMDDEHEDFEGATGFQNYHSQQHHRRNTSNRQHYDGEGQYDDEEHYEGEEHYDGEVQYDDEVQYADEVHYDDERHHVTQQHNYNQRQGYNQ